MEGSYSSSYDGNGGEQNKTKDIFNSLKSPIKVLRGKAFMASAFFGSVLVFQIMLELLGRTYEDEFNSFHDHEHWPGYMLMFMRCCLCVVFVIGINKSIKESNTESPTRSFLEFLRFVGVTWFLSFPLIVSMQWMFAPVNRHMLVTAASIFIQTSSLGTMLYAFLTEHSQYVKISSVGRMKDFGDMFGSALNSGSGMMRKGFFKKVAVD